MSNTPDNGPKAALERLRGQIDSIDDQLADLLRQRINVVQEVAALKAEHWPGDCHIRPGREGQMHRRIAEKFKGSAFTPRAALALWRQLIGASTHLESPLLIGVASPEHAALAREYFGASAGIAMHRSLPELMGALESQQCNIILAAKEQLPQVAAGASDVFVFAQLPLIADAHANAYAIGRVTPEASGKDISFYVADGALHVLEGFITPEQTTLKNARWLGAHPCPPVLD
jgi:chorismate mutase